MKRLVLTAVAAVLTLSGWAAADGKGKDTSTRSQRNLIVEGNKMFRSERYADAEVAYRKALQEDALNEIARFNLAASLLRQGQVQASAGEFLRKDRGQCVPGFLCHGVSRWPCRCLRRGRGQAHLRTR